MHAEFTQKKQHTVKRNHIPKVGITSFHFQILKRMLFS